MLSRSVRAETRQSRKEDIKRVMHNIDKVRQREKTFLHLYLNSEYWFVKNEVSQSKGGQNQMYTFANVGNVEV